MSTTCACFLLVISISSLQQLPGAPIIGKDAFDLARTYLSKYSHLPPKQLTSGDSVTAPYSDDFQEGLKHFQTIVGLKPTGILTSETFALMLKPRCGVIDSRFPKRNKRQTDYVWPTTNLKYRFYSYTLKLPTQVTRDTFTEAFRQWTDVTPLTITEASPQEMSPHISISFVSGDHGDGFPFDGPSNGKTGNTLAHTFLPADGRSHYDESEDWTVGTYEGYNLLSVATHESGHALGLSHYPDPRDIMYALYTPYSPNFSISPNDVQRIQRLYGSKNVDNLPPTPSFDASTTEIKTSTTSTTKTITSTLLRYIATPFPSNNNINNRLPTPFLSWFITTTSTKLFVGTKFLGTTRKMGSPLNVALPKSTTRKSFTLYQGTPEFPLAKTTKKF